MKVDVIELMEKYRVNNRYSQDGMADLLGTSQPTYNRMRRGDYKIPHKLYPAIAKQLGLRLRDILPPEFREEDNDA